MGYYLGLHNNIESVPEYNLVGMYGINEGEWYQAIFESSEADKQLAELGDNITEAQAKEITSMYPSITLKVNKGGSIDSLIEPYKDSYDKKEDSLIEGVRVYFERKSDDSKYNLAYFSVPNGKCYSIFTEDGINETKLVSMLTELINNLKIMSDWST